MKTRKEVKEYLEELEEQLFEQLTGQLDDEEARIIEIQMETLEWVLK